MNYGKTYGGTILLLKATVLIREQSDQWFTIFTVLSMNSKVMDLVQWVWVDSDIMVTSFGIWIYGCSLEFLFSILNWQSLLLNIDTTDYKLPKIMHTWTDIKESCSLGKALKLVMKNVQFGLLLVHWNIISQELLP